MLRSGPSGGMARMVLSIGAVGTSVPAGLREPPPRQVADDVGSLVRVVSVQPRDVAVTVKGFDTVRAKHHQRRVGRVLKGRYAPFESGAA